MLNNIEPALIYITEIDFTEPNALNGAVVVLSLLILSLIFRVLAGLSYYTHLSAFVIFAKTISRTDEVKKTPSSLINRSVADYIACGENGSPLIHVSEIVNRNLLRMNFLGINLLTFEKFSKHLEAAALLCGVFAVVIIGDASYLLLLGVVYFLYRAILLFFDAGVLRERLYFGLVTYLNKELGRFFMQEDTAGFRIFKNELHMSLTEQASVLQNAINNLSSSVTGITKESYGNLTKYIEGVLGAYSTMSGHLSEPVERLGSSFNSFNKAAETIGKNATALNDSVSKLDKKITLIADGIKETNASSIKSAEKTDELFLEIKENLKSFSLAYEALESELTSAKSAQNILDNTIKNYEASMEKTTLDFGDAIGRIAEYKGKEAADTLNEALSKYLMQFQSDTAKMLDTLNTLFEKLYEQNRSEIQTLYRIEDKLSKDVNNV